MTISLRYAIHFVADMERPPRGVRFRRPPTRQRGITLAEFVDSEGARVSLSG